MRDLVMSVSKLPFDTDIIYLVMFLSTHNSLLMIPVMIALYGLAVSAYNFCKSKLNN